VALRTLGQWSKVNWYHSKSIPRLGYPARVPALVPFAEPSERLGQDIHILNPSQKFGRMDRLGRYSLTHEEMRA
jgi:hypothetical protein